MNGNRINLADIYGLNRNDDKKVYGNTMDMAPPALEQLANRHSTSSTGEIAVNRNVSETNEMNNAERNRAENELDRIMINSETAGNGFDMDRCQVGRCRFAPIPHEHTVEGNLPTDNTLTPITEYNQPYPINSENIQYLNTFIRSQVGRRVHVEFLIGMDIVEKDGYLVAVGANFILLNPINTKDMLACDFHNIKFMKFYY